MNPASYGPSWALAEPGAECQGAKVSVPFAWVFICLISCGWSAGHHAAGEMSKVMFNPRARVSSKRTPVTHTPALAGEGAILACLTVLQGPGSRHGYFPIVPVVELKAMFWSVEMGRRAHQKLKSAMAGTLAQGSPRQHDRAQEKGHITGNRWAGLFPHSPSSSFVCLSFLI